MTAPAPIPTTILAPARPGDLITLPDDWPTGWVLIGMVPAAALVPVLISRRLRSADAERVRAEALAALLLPGRAARCAHCGRPYLPHRPAAEGEGTWCPLDGCQRARERAKNRASWRRARERARSADEAPA